MARIITDPTVSWRSENAAVAESDPVFDNVSFTARSLAVFFKVSRELFADSVNINEACQRVLTGAMAVEVDRVCLLGSGSAPQPKGIVNFSGIGSVSMGTNGAQLTNYDKLLDTYQALLDAKAADPTAAIMAPRTMISLDKLKDTTNQPMQRPTSLSKLPFLTTTGMPVNETQGTANNASTTIIGNFRELMIGMRQELVIEVLRELYAPNLQFAFVAHLRMDVQLQHPASFAKLVGIIP